ADSRMERRLGELGVRRAFGAPKGSLIGQVLIENFLYTLLGGLVGLLFSFLLVTFASSWVFKVGKGFSEAAPDGVDVSLSMGMLLNPWVFLIALCVCFLLNLMSALWPAWRASRRPIVDSLNA
ncbi:ABC transporter permease, partial [Alistipes putredinis]